MRLVQFTIRGLNPGIVTNPATATLLDQLRTKTPGQKKLDWTPENEAASKIYRSGPTEKYPNGGMGIPIQNIISCLVSGGQHVKSSKTKISTAKTTTVFDFLDFLDDFCVFTNCDESGNVPWAPLKVKGNMHRGAETTAVCIVRPRIPRWSLTFTVKFNDKRGISYETLEELVKVAGRKAGLCDWRPTCKGRFGRFEVTKVESMDSPSEEFPIERVEYNATNAPAELLALLETVAE